MRTSKFTPEQMVHVLRQGESGVPIAELCRQHQISEQTYYRWKKQFGDRGTAEVRELRQLRARESEAEAAGRGPLLGQADTAGGDRKKDLTPRSNRACGGVTRPRGRVVR